MKTLQDKQGKHWNIHEMAALIRAEGRLGTDAYVSTNGLRCAIGVIADAQFVIPQGKRFDMNDVANWLSDNFKIDTVGMGDNLRDFSPAERALLMAYRIDNLEPA